MSDAELWHAHSPQVPRRILTFCWTRWRLISDGRHVRQGKRKNPARRRARKEIARVRPLHCNLILRHNPVSNLPRNGLREVRNGLPWRENPGVAETELLREQNCKSLAK